MTRMDRIGIYFHCNFLKMLFIIQFVLLQKHNNFNCICLMQCFIFATENSNAFDCNFFHGIWNLFLFFSNETLYEFEVKVTEIAWIWNHLDLKSLGFEITWTWNHLVWNRLVWIISRTRLKKFSPRPRGKSVIGKIF